MSGTKSRPLSCSLNLVALCQKTCRKLCRKLLILSAQLRLLRPCRKHKFPAQTIIPHAWPESL
jgi:hypothetical protein